MSHFLVEKEDSISWVYKKLFLLNPFLPPWPLRELWNIWMFPLFPSSASNKDLLFPKSSQTHKVNATKSKDVCLLACLGTPHSNLLLEQKNRHLYLKTDTEHENSAVNPTNSPDSSSTQLITDIQTPERFPNQEKRCFEGQSLPADFIPHYK